MSEIFGNKISESDLEVIASMHICPRKSAVGLKSPASKFRFFLDKVRHFYEFDPDSIIVCRDAEGRISGVLIYTYSEKAFNQFSGPIHIRFYVKLLKTLLGLYGFEFRKFFIAAKSMLGFGERKIHSLSAGKNNDANFAKIWVLIVAEEERKKGIASKLLQTCLEEAKKRKIRKVRVTVKTDNQPAIRAYEKNGFHTIGECVESSGKSFIMEKELDLVDDGTR